MTRTPETLTCADCTRPFTWLGGPGPRPSYCTIECRARAHHRRQKERGYRTPSTLTRLDPAVHARLKAWCGAEQRSMHSVLNRIVTRFLDKQEGR